MAKRMAFGRVLFFAILAISLSCEEYDKDINGDFDGENLDDRGSGDGDIYEAEARTGASGCSVKSNHPGYSGSGFMDYGGNGTWIEWKNVRAAGAGEYKLTFRYGNGSKGNRQAAAIINGQNIGNVKFTPTGSWRTWKTDAIVVSLKAGNNTIRIVANTGSGGPNLDNMVVATIGGTGSSSCAEAAEHKSASLSCQNGETIVSIDFASYGLPTGSCDTGFKTASCHAASSKSKVEASCLNRQSCTVTASNGVFGDPCRGTFKKIAIAYTCSGGSVDQCPNDPNKTVPGECGCGVPEGSCDGECTNVLLAHEKLVSGEHICSENGKYEFGLTPGGELALWSSSGKLWSAGTFGSSVHLIMQGDGNLVVYNGTQARWSSKTHGNSGATLKLENDGRAVIRLGTKVLWSVGGSGPVDNCPGDPNKTEPGECGCGVPEGTCNNDESWTFVVVGDSRGSNNGVNTSVWGHMVDAIIDEGAEFVLFPGDLTTGGDRNQFEQWLDTTQPLYDANIDVYAVRGNHDDSSLSAWNNAFSGGYRFPQNGPSNARNLTYSATHKNAFIVGLDNYSNSAEVDQNWFKAQLAANTKPHVFVFGHEPAFAADHSDTLDDHSSARNTFWESIKDAGGRAYFAGHDHFYDHARIDDRDGNSSDDVHQFIVGTAGAPLYNFNGNYTGNNGNYKPVQEHFERQYGYIVIHVDGLKVQMTFKKRSGSSYVAVDRFNYTAK